jgi:hypothetical protein
MSFLHLSRYEQPKCDNTARAHPTKARDLYKGRQLQGEYQNGFGWSTSEMACRYRTMGKHRAFCQALSLQADNVERVTQPLNMRKKPHPSEVRMVLWCSALRFLRFAAWDCIYLRKAGIPSSPGISLAVS